MPLRLPEKEQLALYLIDYPVLNAILRMLLYERAFRIAVVGLLLLALCIPLSLARIWTATPKGFSPVVKVRGLDYLEARSLRRTALKQVALEQYDDALYSWRVAVQNNPGDPELLRGCLTTLFHSAEKRQLVPILVGHSRWLLRLTRTNEADLELSVRLYAAFALEDLTLQTLAPLETQLTPTLETCYLKALFNRNQFAKFDSQWEEAHSRGVNLTDSELALYQAAYNAGWGLLDKAAEARNVLNAAKEDPAHRVLAHRLQLKVSERLVQPEIYRQSLDLLQELRQDRVQDHIGYWQILAAVGRKNEALKLINAHVTPPNSGEETVLLAKAHFDLGQKDKSREILERYAPEYGDSEAVWVTYANLLTDQQRWDDLINVALLVRHENNPLRDVLADFSYYIEGLAQLQRGRFPDATNAFTRILSTKMNNKVWDLIISEKLETLGFAEISKSILLRIQKDSADNPGFWLLLAKSAFDLRDPQLLVTSMSGAFKIQPNNPMIAHNYAAALISTRQRPEEALKVTSELLEKQPASAAVRINYALALLQNQRLTDAESALGALDPARLTGADLTSYHYARFELAFDRQQYQEARQVADRIQAEYLLPPEKQWLERARLKMEGSPPPKKA